MTLFSVTPLPVTLFSVTLFSVTPLPVTLFSVTLFSVTPLPVTLFSVTLFSVTLLSGFHLLGEELTQSHSFNCHKQLQVKSEAELRSVQNIKDITSCVVFIPSDLQMSPMSVCERDESAECEPEHVTCLINHGSLSADQC